MKKPIKIELKFNISDDDPLKAEIGKKFSELMEVLQRPRKEKNEM